MAAKNSGLEDVLTAAAGGAYLVAHSISDGAKEQDGAVTLSRQEAADAYVKSHANLELQSKLYADLLVPFKTWEIWARLEDFKRDNPDFCEEHPREYSYSTYPKITYTWRDVGNSRPALFSEKGLPFPKNQREYDELASTRDSVLDLLMETYGERPVRDWEFEARLKYGVKPSGYY